MVETTAPNESWTSGFSLPFGGAEARRQLQISFGLVTMLAIGIVSAGVAVGGHPLSVKQDMVASRTPVTVMQAETRITGAKPI